MASTAKNSLVGFPLFATAAVYLEIVLKDPLIPKEILFSKYLESET